MATEKQGMTMMPYTLTELGRLYGVCNRTVKKWLEPFDAEIGEKRGRYYTVNQVKTIIEKLGAPSETPIE
jgi:hypothetical protein